MYNDVIYIFRFEVDVKYNVEIKEEKKRGRTHETRQQTRLNARRTTLYKRKKEKEEGRT